MKKVRLWIILAAVLVLLIFLLPIIDDGGLIRLVAVLVVGWISFLARVLPQVTINWSGIGMVVVCSGLILASMHWLCQWLYAHWVRQGSPDAPTRWRWTWTASLYGGLWLLFLAAMGVTGVVHQVGWLATSKEPLYIVRSGGSPVYYLRIAESELYTAGVDEGWRPAETRRSFESSSSVEDRRKLHPVEDLHTLYIEGPSNKLAAVILFHRDPKTRERLGFRLISPEKQIEGLKMDQLPSVLARYQH